MTNRGLPFQQIAEAALARAEQLVAQWCPDGRRDGYEWKALNPTRADTKVGSFSINLNTGMWADFADDARGGDLVSLYAYLFHGGDQGAAARELADQLHIEILPAGPGSKASPPKERQPEPAPGQRQSAAAAPKPEKKPRTDWVPVLPVPEGAPPPPVAHIHRGKPEAGWTYRARNGQVLGYIWRFTDSSGDKEIIPLTYCQHKVTGKFDWRHIAFPDPRPLYGLELLDARPEAAVLIVEGEKCADAANKAQDKYIALSWPGGSKAVQKADWRDLAGRRVTFFADCDSKRDKKTQEILLEEKQPGIAAMNQARTIVAALPDTSTFMVEIALPGSVPDGWDVADMIADGLTGEELVAWINRQTRETALVSLTPPPDDTPPVGEKTPPNATKATAKKGGKSPADRPYVPGLVWTKNGLASAMSNVHQILLFEPAWKGVIAFDEFSQRVVKLKPPPYEGGKVGEWDSIDDSCTAIWMARNWDFTPASDKVAEAVEVVSRRFAFHPVRDWLRSLPKWDGIERRFDWLSDYVGVKPTEYSRKVAGYFLLGMVARVMFPGVKFDYCLVLEGKQGRGKSTAFRILGGDWYGDTDLDLQNKDAMSALRGRWLHEFSEMGSVTKAESTKQKSFLSRMVDEYRPVYGRREIKSPRQVAFGGTTNEWEWNKDPTGGRRFWPALCEGEFNLDGLRKMREQLFAEVFQLFMAGVEKYGHPERFEGEYRFWPTADEQQQLFDPEQLKVEVDDGLVDALHDWVFEQLEPFAMAHVVMKVLNLDASKLTPAFTTKVGMALRKLGCTKVERRNGTVRFLYKPPPREERWSSSKTGAASPDAGGSDVGF